MWYLGDRLSARRLSGESRRKCTRIAAASGVLLLHGYGRCRTICRATCRGNGQSFYQETPLPDSIWDALPSQPWLSLGATGLDQFQVPQEMSAPRSTAGGAHLGGCALYSKELVGKDIAHALNRVSACQDQPSTVSYLCSDVQGPGSTGAHRLLCSIVRTMVTPAQHFASPVACGLCCVVMS